MAVRPGLFYRWFLAVDDTTLSPLKFQCYRFLAKYRLPEEVYELFPSAAHLFLLGDQMRWAYLQDGHLVFDVTGKTVIEIPGVQQPQQQTRRSESLPAVYYPGEMSVGLLNHPGKMEKAAQLGIIEVAGALLFASQ